MAQLPQVPQIENGKPDFSPTFQKVELRNSTFFQLEALSIGRSIHRLHFIDKLQKMFEIT